MSRSKDDVQAELDAHADDLKAFEKVAAAYEPGSDAEAEAHQADVAAFRARHKARTEELLAELA